MEANLDKHLDSALPEAILPWPSWLYEKLNYVGFLLLLLFIFGFVWPKLDFLEFASLMEKDLRLCPGLL